jgi:uncharacterized protein
MSMTRILSIDGGGIRGIIPGQVLVTLEKLLQKHSNRKDARIADYFDLIAGTSTGGILSLIYLCPDNANQVKSKFTAGDAVKLYSEHGGFIFKASALQRFLSLCGLISGKYSTKNFELLLDHYLGDAKLSDLLKPCLITAYDVRTHHTIFFNKMNAVHTNRRDFYLKDIARATSAAPTYFPTANISSIPYIRPTPSMTFMPSIPPKSPRNSISSPPTTNYSLIDGGVFANNPTLCAYAEATKLDGNPGLEDMLFLSLGTGAFEPDTLNNNIPNWGVLQWALPLFNIMMSGVSETVDYQISQLYKSLNKSDQYLRIQPSLKGLGKAIHEMDNTSDSNIVLLKKIGIDISNSYYTRLDNFAKLLVAQ